MNIEYIQKKIRSIRLDAECGDPERASAMERQLWLEVMTHVACGREDAAELCKEALKSINIIFFR